MKTPINAIISSNGFVRQYVNNNKYYKTQIKEDNISSKKKTREEIDNKGKEDFYNLRLKWSLYIFVWVTGIILFQMSFVVLIGLKLLNYEASSIIYATMAETILQIIGMGVVVVIFLFKEKQEPQQYATRDIVNKISD